MAEIEKSELEKAQELLLAKEAEENNAVLSKINQVLDESGKKFVIDGMFNESGIFFNVRVTKK